MAYNDDIRIAKVPVQKCAGLFYFRNRQLRREAEMDLLLRLFSSFTNGWLRGHCQASNPRERHAFKFTDLILLSIVLPVCLYGTNITGNLLLNPGAETGTLSNWTIGGTSNPGVDNGSFDPGINPHTGGFDFFGRTGVSGTLTQNVSLVGVAGVSLSAIDTGQLLANI